MDVGGGERRGGRKGGNYDGGGGGGRRVDMYGELDAGLLCEAVAAAERRNKEKRGGEGGGEQVRRERDLSELEKCGLKRDRREGGEGTKSTSKRQKFSVSSDHCELQTSMLGDYIMLMKGEEGGEGGGGYGMGCGFCLAETGTMFGGGKVHNAKANFDAFTKGLCPQFTMDSRLTGKFMHFKCVLCLVHHDGVPKNDDGSPKGGKTCPLKRKDQGESKIRIAALKEGFKKCEACHIRDMAEFRKTDFHVADVGSNFGFKKCNVAKESDVVMRVCVALFRRKPKVLLRIVGGRKDFDELGKGTREFLGGVMREKSTWWSDQALIAQQGVTGGELHESLPPFYEYYGWLYKDWCPGGPFTNASVIFLVFLKYFMGDDFCAVIHEATFRKIRALE